MSTPTIEDEQVQVGPAPKKVPDDIVLQGLYRLGIPAVAIKCHEPTTEQPTMNTTTTPSTENTQPRSGFGPNLGAGSSERLSNRKKRNWHTPALIVFLVVSVVAFGFVFWLVINRDATNNPQITALQVRMTDLEKEAPPTVEDLINSDHFKTVIGGYFDRAVAEQVAVAKKAMLAEFNEKLAAERKMIVAEAKQAAVNTLVFEETPVTIKGVQGTMFLAFDEEDGTGMIQFTPKSTTVTEASAPTETPAQ